MRRGAMLALVAFGVAIAAGLIIGGAPAPAAAPGVNGKIAFERHTDSVGDTDTSTDNDEVFLMDADGSNQVNLSDFRFADDREPAFSPNGTRPPPPTATHPSPPTAPRSPSTETTTSTSWTPRARGRPTSPTQTTK